MTKCKLLLSSAMTAATALWLSGCGASSSSPPRPPQSSHEAHGDHAHGEHAHTDAVEIAEQLAKLSPEERVAAEKQKICPVTGEPLGAMGVPPKVSVNGREVFLCCESCEEAFKKDPEKHLAKLPR